MPELPEVENVRQSLATKVVGRSVVRAQLRRDDVVHGEVAPTRSMRIAEVIRHGKQLAIVSAPTPAPGSVPAPTPVICVHLGMSGSLCAAPANHPQRPHTHAIWRLDNDTEIRFADPRRFGGVWVYRDPAELWRCRWSALGPDALRITPAVLHRRLIGTTRALKAALLDQGLVAGLGNIYVDELLAGMKLHPLRRTDTLDRGQCVAMVRRMRGLLGRAIAAGGSTLRDYVNADGIAGGFQLKFKVYGRAGQACRRCGGELASIRVAQRTTVFCGVCQG